MMAPDNSAEARARIVLGSHFFWGEAQQWQRAIAAMIAFSNTGGMPGRDREASAALCNAIDRECQAAGVYLDTDLIDRLAALSPTTTAVEEMRGWQDIASAPTDGTAIIGHRHDGSVHGFVRLAMWVVDMDGDEVAYAGWWDPDSDQDWEPTSWIPYPAFGPALPVSSIGGNSRE